jgi:hypothetical protein
MPGLDARESPPGEEAVKGRHSPYARALMFSWFQRGREYIRHEAREVSKGAYELVVLMPDGTERIEPFSDQAALKDREVAFTRELEDAGWTGPHGWNL